MRQMATQRPHEEKRLAQGQQQRARRYLLLPGRKRMPPDGTCSICAPEQRYASEVLRKRQFLTPH